MSKQRPCDKVDTILQQWRRERPDLDVSPMGPIGRLGRCAALLRRRLDRTFTDFSMTSWEFDVLATLRRNGQPHCMAPTALFSDLMITSGTMTHRLQRLEGSGLVRRVPNSKDARSMLVQLTPAGLALINRAVEAHIENERTILSALPAADLAALDDHLSALLLALEGEEEAGDDQVGARQE
ncbi:MarR family transcriptional regulator [Affinibrenneria salicis]|uniref:MarR family transcriptional regulator n=1 Tax=Affinibrenneria salicis TaxID=2590031 RepID=A0A5J5FWZ1_9GAMM|nr:MarR family transcriptional regulator [Affinibrenneria salicis]KAA8998468.1 MarR family transcriptional regulator [Affinibrenneria salicis]